ncbi:MAG: NusG domain II-containing protein [Anaeroplasmataceae bacterium]|nr:NusG domain II-containing protein [Anaeroplasmataceae bacterium]
MHKKRNDIILIGCIVIFIMIGLFIILIQMQKKEELYVKIYFDNELVETINMNKDKEFYVNGVEIVIHDKKVYVENSTCKDHVCMHQGKIWFPGQTITCLPQRVVIRIDGEGVDVGI